MEAYLQELDDIQLGIAIQPQNLDLQQGFHQLVIEPANVIVIEPIENYEEELDNDDQDIPDLIDLNESFDSGICTDDDNSDDDEFEDLEGDYLEDHALGLM